MSQDTNLKKPIMTISPDAANPTDQSLDIGVLNELFDAVIVQSYERVGYIDNYVNAKVKNSILFCGICSENDPTSGFYPPNSDILKYIQKLDQYDLAGLYAWRIDNDNTSSEGDFSRPTYTITAAMAEYVRGAWPDPPLY